MNLFSSHGAGQITRLVQLSDGTRLAEPADDGTRRYRAGACIPQEPWRRAEVADLAIHFNSGHRWQQDRSIVVARLPAAQRLAIERLGLASLPTVAADSNRTISRVGRQCLEIIADYFRCSSATRCYGLGINGPDMVTTSIDRNIDRIVGLHVDHWDQLPLTARSTAGNRLAINVGESTYYFLLLPATLEEMTRGLGLPYTDDVDLNELPGRFMAAFPDRPVCRFEVAPGDVYIAPTDNVIHDGSSTGITAASRQIVFRGVIEPSAIAYRSLFREWSRAGSS
jgi:hypothetical protein